MRRLFGLWPATDDLVAVTAKVPMIDRVFGTNVFDLHAEAGGITLIDVRECAEYAASRATIGANRASHHSVGIDEPSFGGTSSKFRANSQLRETTRTGGALVAIRCINVATK